MVETKFLILGLILSVILPGGEMGSISEIVKQCKEETSEFIKTEEEKYADPDPLSYVQVRVGNLLVPNIVGIPVWSTLEEIYKMECRQRVLECIANKTEEQKHTKEELEQNKDYQDIVRECRQRQENITCDPKCPYRTIDGTCNNLKNKRWGSTYNCFNRLLPPVYDGVSNFRRSVCDKPLPDARNISLLLNPQKDRLNLKISLMFVFTGQLWAHDISDVSMTSIGNKTIDCCSKSGEPHPQCSPVAVPGKDPFYSKYNITCLGFIRASLCETCEAGKRNQMSQCTAYLDASFVYGSDKDTQESLRGEKGRLIVQQQNLLPRLYGPFTDCGPPGKNQYCFHAGDRRVNMHTLIMILQTVLVREHNRLAGKLKKLNPDWSGEKCYQETRKINIAQVQVLVYKEYLPLLLGPCLMAEYNLTVRKGGWTTYNPSLDATMLAEFNTAAYRLHTLLFRVITQDKGVKILLRDMFGDASYLYNNKSDKMVKDVCQKPSQRYDRYIDEDMTNYMFRVPNNPGTDIASWSLKRVWDLGVAPYLDVVNYLVDLCHKCYPNIRKLETFEDFKQLMSIENVALLEKLYCDGRDVDLWAAVFLERVEKGNVVGPTAGIIIAIQFWLLKFGDRFYWEHEGQFSKDQLNVLGETTMTKIFCRNTAIKELPENVFLLEDINNPTIKCSAVREMDLSPWKEKKEGGSGEQAGKKENGGKKEKGGEKEKEKGRNKEKERNEEGFLHSLLHFLPSFFS